ncbi:MAG TPA: ABC transporter permease [Pyrinomonadaceae bacterium]
MSKLLSIIKREYVQGVRSKTFVVSTILGPAMLFVFAVVPSLLFGMKAGGATRVAILDETGRLYESVRESVTRKDEGESTPGAGRGPESAARRAGRDMEASYVVEQVALPPGGSLEEARRDLNGRIKSQTLDAYVILPRDIMETGRARFYSRSLGDVISIARLEDRLSRAVKEQRMRDSGIDPGVVQSVNREVEMSRHKPGEEGEEGTESSLFLALTVGMFIFIATMMYGQAILSAVVEEKTTRIAEMLFSSTDAFTLMAGKLVGVSLLGLTQYALWALLFVGVSVFGVGAFSAGGMDFTLPNIPPVLALYALLFFLLGFYIYATMYAVVGAMVSSEKEGAQLAYAVMMLPMAAIYLAFPVIRSPGSDFAFWVSMIPFFSPITMIVRIVAETPPFWQIALSLAVGLATVVVLVWVAARIYRTGMLMYGKRATIPEIIRWARRA